MNGTTQSAHSKLVARIEEVLPSIIAEAVEKETAPMKAEIEAHRKLVNETQQTAIADVKKATDALSNKQMEIHTLRDQLSKANRDLATASNDLAILTGERDRLKSQLTEATKRHETELATVKDEIAKRDAKAEVTGDLATA